MCIQRRLETNHRILVKDSRKEDTALTEKTPAEGLSLITAHPLKSETRKMGPCANQVTGKETFSIEMLHHATDNVPSFRNIHFYVQERDCSLTAPCSAHSDPVLSTRHHRLNPWFKYHFGMRERMCHTVS